MELKGLQYYYKGAFSSIYNIYKRGLENFEMHV